jgi:hypothetical protein
MMLMIVPPVLMLTEDQSLIVHVLMDIGMIKLPLVTHVKSNVPNVPLLPLTVLFVPLPELLTPNQNVHVLATNSLTTLVSVNHVLSDVLLVLLNTSVNLVPKTELVPQIVDAQITSMKSLIKPFVKNV